jgi:electron transfer flavoprotein alpha subunit
MAGGIWVIGEPKGSGLARISAEAATLARALGEASARDAVGVVAGAGIAQMAQELAAYVPRVLALEVPDAAGRVTAAAIAPALVALVEREQPSHIIIGATSDGRDLAGTLSALLGWGVLVNAAGVSWGDDGPSVEMAVFGGKLRTTSVLTADHGIVTVGASSVSAEPAAGPGVVEAVTVAATAALPAVSVLESVSEVSGDVPIEEARVIVAGGRGVGGPDGFALVGELARALGGSVGASRAAVDSGWIPYSQQIGQTGKVVKPQLYVALGISGAIQHTVGIQSAETIVAVNRDPDAPIVEFADLVVLGDLFTVVPAIVAELRARGG